MQVVECLSLSYHNTQKLHQILDNIPSCAEWKTWSLWFRSDPHVKHYIHYRNPLDAIRSLLGNPTHTKHIIYKPKKIFINARKEKRIYHEMWTGRWWNVVQVCDDLLSFLLAYLVSGKFTWGGQRCSRYHIYRQDSAYSVFWGQGCISCLPHSRQHSPSHPSKAQSKCLYFNRLFTCEQGCRQEPDSKTKICLHTAAFPRFNVSHSWTPHHGRERRNGSCWRGW